MASNVGKENIQVQVEAREHVQTQVIWQVRKKVRNEYAPDLGLSSLIASWWVLFFFILSFFWWT